MESEPLSEARLRHQLDVQSRQINRVLDHHNVPAGVVGGTVRPRVVSFDLQSQIAAGLERVRGLKEDLMSALGVRDIAVVREEGQWRLRVTRPDDAPVPLLPLLATLPTLGPTTAVIGLADGGQPVLLRFGAGKVKHVLIAGETGAGKTTLLRTFAASLALTNRQSALQLLMMDPRGLADDPVHGGIHPLRPLALLPHMLTDPTGDPTDCAAVVHFLAEEMEYRRQERTQTPRIVALIDHVVTLIDEGGRQVRSDLLRLLQHGATVGIHLVMSTDRPDAPFLLERTLRAGISVRIIGRLRDTESARRVAGIPLDKSALLYGEGDFLAVVGDDVTYFQAAHLGDYDLHMKLSQMAAASRPRLLAVPYDPRPRLTREPDTTNQTFRWNDGAVSLDMDVYEPLPGDDPADLNEV